MTLSAILSIITSILMGVAKLLKALGPSPLVAESEKAGAATQEVQVLEAHDAEVQEAADAGDAAEHLSAAGLRQFEQHDPNNRDNSAG